jgi:hypothetical protein
MVQEKFSLYCEGRQVSPRADLDDMEKWQFLTQPGFELRPFGRPARGLSL